MFSETKTFMDFRKKYPLSAREAAYTPLILRAGFAMRDSLPYPSRNGIEDFAAYCGIRNGAIRTALSRAHSEGEISVFRDAAGVRRYRLAESMLEMGKTGSSRSERPEGFIIAVFSFTKDEERERIKVRETLKFYGFKKLAQNTYINGRIETDGLKKAMKEFGLEKNLYLFHCPDVDDADLMEKILSVFEVGRRTEQLREFHDDLDAFLKEENLSGDEIVHRIYYCGPVYWTVCHVDEPPFPRKHLPEDYPLEAVIGLYTGFLEEHMELLAAHYLRTNV